MPDPVVFLRPPIVALAAAALALAACRQDNPAPIDADVVQVPITPPSEPTPQAILGRADLLAAAAEAASAHASGIAPEGADALAGRRFAVRLAFGCDGPRPQPAAEAAGDGLARWDWTGDREGIRLSLTAADWTEADLVAGGSTGWEAVEGFWVERPWMTTDGCPAAVRDPLATGALQPTPQSVGIAAVFDEGGSRLSRRNGRAYQYGLRSPDGTPLTAPAAGYRVALEGRVAAFPDGRAVHCRSEAPNRRPVCVVAVRLDRVAFESAAGDTLSQWRPG